MNASVQSLQHERIIGAAIAEGSLELPPPPQIASEVMRLTRGDAIIAVSGPDVDAIIQVGTNLAMARLAGIAELWLDKPVLAINTCIYWWSLRQNGIDDRIEGFGSLLLQH